MRLGVVVRTAAVLVILGCLVPPTRAEMVTLSSEKFGAWEVRKSEDQLDSSVRWVAAASSEDGKTSLIFKCDGGKFTEVYAAIIFAHFIGVGDDAREFVWRIDKNPPKTRQWNYDGRTAYSLEYATVWDMVSEIRDGAVFRARGIDFDYGNHDVMIPIKGGRQALKKVFEGCGSKRWKD